MITIIMITINQQRIARMRVALQTTLIVAVSSYVVLIIAQRDLVAHRRRHPGHHSQHRPVIATVGMAPVADAGWQGEGGSAG